LGRYRILIAAADSAEENKISCRMIIALKGKGEEMKSVSFLLFVLLLFAKPGLSDTLKSDESINVDVMEALDVNCDMKVSKDEWNRSEELFNKYDGNGDGFVAVEEFYAYNDRKKAGKQGPGKRTRPGGFRGRRGAQGNPADRMDSDGDGVLSEDEWKGPPQAFSRIDSNGDGKLTKNELEKAHQKRMQMMRERFGRRFGRNRQSRLRGRLKKLREWDSDGDGGISKEEWQGRSNVFDKFDEDSDGKVSREEVQSVMKKLMQRRQRGGMMGRERNRPSQGPPTEEPTDGDDE